MCSQAFHHLAGLLWDAAPVAAWSQLWGKPLAPAPGAAAAIIVVAVEVARSVSGKLPGAPAGKKALASTGDQEVEAVNAADVVTDVRDLHDVPLVDQFRVRPPESAALPLPFRFKNER